MPRKPLWYLQNIELFAGVSEEDMAELIKNVTQKQYDRRQFLYTPEERVENVFILKEGEVTLYKSMTDGKRVILDILKPGAVFGNISFDPDTGEPHYAEITEKAFICTLPHDYFLQVLARRPDIALRALTILSRRLQQYELQIRALSSLQARERILATVRLINEKDEHSILPKVLRRPTRLTHEKLGAMTGLSRETVTKLLSELKHDGLVDVHGKVIRLTENGQKAVAMLV
jgi:CRP/FNR family transcriptional regulator